ncbi:MAG: choice-of-anchor tandem repeat GloVer-containing protein [Candidatus Korobacteraceae bacterium]
MTTRPRFAFHLRLRSFALITLCALTMMATQPARAQTYKVLYNFTGGTDGANPYDGLTMDAAGNLYGTASAGGCTGGACASDAGCGTVFKLSHHGSGWIFTPLYAFQGDDGTHNDAATPVAGVTFGPDGSLYGATEAGGAGSCYYFHDGCGAVFKLSPPPTVCKSALCPWDEAVIYRLAYNNGEESQGNVIFDAAGNLYGTVDLGGQYNGGYVFELTPSSGGWTEQTLYSFNPLSGDCGSPTAGLVFDNSGDLYGTTFDGCADNYGGVFQLTPSGSGWTENILLSFNGTNGDTPYAGLMSDSHGNLYGTTFGDGPNGGGTAFELSPSSGGWAYSLVYAFGNPGDGALSSAPVSMDASGNLYGTTRFSTSLDYGDGIVYKLTPSNDTWTETVLHYFEGSDGQFPTGGVLVDANGNLYGTTSYGGAYGNGVVWEITP